MIHNPIFHAFFNHEIEDKNLCYKLNYDSFYYFLLDSIKIRKIKYL